MKKFSFWMLAAILTFCGATMTLTSCSEKIDTPVVPINPSEKMTEAELKQALIGLHIDASDYVTGEEAFRVWDMKDDNTFTAYDLYYDDSLTFVVDTVKGTWKPLLRVSVPLSKFGVVCGRRSVDVFHKVRCVLRSSRSEVDSQHGLYSEALAPAQELIGPHEVGFYLEPCEIEPRRSLFLGTYTVFPAVSGEKVASGVAYVGEVERPHEIHDILTEAEFIGCRMVRLIYACIDGSSHVFHEGTVDSVIYSGDDVIVAHSY